MKQRVCLLCKKALSAEETYVQHLQTHDPRSFFVIQNLLHWERGRTDKSEIVCLKCGKTLKGDESPLEHLRNHPLEELFAVWEAQSWQ